MWRPSNIGFGTYHYKTGKVDDMCKIGFSPKRDKFSLYILDYGDEGANKLLPQLGKITKAVTWLYFKKLDNLNLVILEKLKIQSIIQSEKNFVDNMTMYSRNKKMLLWH